MPRQFGEGLGWFAAQFVEPVSVVLHTGRGDVGLPGLVDDCWITEGLGGKHSGRVLHWRSRDGPPAPVLCDRILHSAGYRVCQCKIDRYALIQWIAQTLALHLFDRPLGLVFRNAIEIQCRTHQRLQLELLHKGPLLRPPQFVRFPLAALEDHPLAEGLHDPGVRTGQQRLGPGFIGLLQRFPGLRGIGIAKIGPRAVDAGQLHPRQCEFRIAFHRVLRAVPFAGS